MTTLNTTNQSNATNKTYKTNCYFQEQNYTYNRTHRTEEKESFSSIIRTACRTILSLSIPMSLALFLSLFATFLFHANENASYFYNAWFLFCKLFFPSTPLMMWFITKK